MGMPRRYHAYPSEELSWQVLNILSSAGIGFVFLAIMILYTMTDYLSRNMLGVAGR